jgi:hypothetical protein
VLPASEEKKTVLKGTGGFVSGSPKMLSFRAIVDADNDLPAHKAAQRTSRVTFSTNFANENRFSGTFADDVHRALSACSNGVDWSIHKPMDKPSSEPRDEVSAGILKSQVATSSASQPSKLKLTGDIRLAGSRGSSPLVEQYKRRMDKPSLPILRVSPQGISGPAKPSDTESNPKLDSASDLQLRKILQVERSLTPLDESDSESFEARLDALQERFERHLSHELSLTSRASSQVNGLQTRIDEQDKNIARHSTRVDNLEKARAEADVKLADLEKQIELCKDALALLHTDKSITESEVEAVQPLRINKQSQDLRVMHPSSHQRLMSNKGKLPASAEYRASKEKAHQRKLSMQKYRQECMEQYNLMRAMQADANHDSSILSHVSVESKQYETHSAVTDSPVVPRTPLISEPEEQAAQKPESPAKLMYFRPVKFERVDPQRRPTHVMHLQARKT